MVNLKDLDKKVDKLLESETSNSLTHWLLNKRNKNFSKFSDIKPFNEICLKFCAKIKK